VAPCAPQFAGMLSDIGLIHFAIISRVASQFIEHYGADLSSIPSVGLSVCCVSLLVGRSIRRVYCGKTADCIWMPFGVVSGVGRWIGKLDGSTSSKGNGKVWAFLAPLV